MQFIILVISYVSICFIGALLLYCLANAALRLNSNLPSDLKWILEQAASLDAFLAFVVTIVITSCCMSSLVNNISNHIILSLDIIFFFSSLILILFHTIKQTRFAFGK
jgi:hypothetical protein